MIERIPTATISPNTTKEKRGPEPSSTIWGDRDAFHEALTLHLERHGDTAWHLHKAIIGPKDRIDRKTIAHWAAGAKVPQSVSSLEILARIGKRYRLPTGYFAAKFPHTGRAGSGHTVSPENKIALAAKVINQVWDAA